MDLPKGFILDGKYRLEERIGVGGFGVVYRTTHLKQREVAVKVFRPLPTPSTEDAIARFSARRAPSASRLSHPNAITILDSGIAAGGIPYLAMELLYPHAGRRARASAARCRCRAASRSSSRYATC